MKKILSSLIVFGLLLVNNIPAQAEGNPDLFEAFMNMTKLESYASLQTMTGTVKFKEGEQIGNIKFKLNFKSNVNNVAAFQSNSATEISGHVNLTMEGPGEKPFDAVNANFKADLVLVSEEGFYARLKEVNFEATGVPEKDMTSYLEGQQALKTQLAPVLNEWFFVPIADLSGLSQAQPGLEGLFSQEEILKNLQEVGLKETYTNLARESIQAQVEAGLMTEEDAVLSNEIINMILAAKFLRTKTITQGNNKNFQAFALDKRLISGLVKEIAERQGEQLSERDLQQLEMILSQVGFSGIYRVNPEHRIYDNFLVRLRLREIEDLKLFEISYRLRITQINSAREVVAPADYKTLEESGFSIPYLTEPVPMEEPDDEDAGLLEEELNVIEKETSQ